MKRIFLEEVTTSPWWLDSRFPLVFVRGRNVALTAPSSVPVLKETEILPLWGYKPHKVCLEKEVTNKSPNSSTDVSREAVEFISKKHCWAASKGAFQGATENFSLQQHHQQIAFGQNCWWGDTSHLPLFLQLWAEKPHHCISGTYKTVYGNIIYRV